MCPYEKETDQALKMPYKNHGPGGELPTVIIGGDTAKQEAVPREHREKQETAVLEKPDSTRIKECVKRIAPIVAMSGVVFWWQQSGQLAQTTGFYALIVLALMTGLTAGKYLTR